MFLTYRTRGLFIKKENRGEADILFSVYTKDFGRIDVLGKSIRKISSKLRSGAEIFYLSEIEFIQAKRQKTLIEAILIDDFKYLRKDLARLKAAYQISEIMDDFVKQPERDKKVWNLLIKVFKKINSPKFPSRSSALIYQYFLFNLLSLLGYGVKLQDFRGFKSFSKTYISRKLGIIK